MKLSVRIDGLGTRIAPRLPERIRDAVRAKVRGAVAVPTRETDDRSKPGDDET